MEIKRADPDQTPLRFGKYKGSTPKEIAEFDPGYIVWLYDTIKPSVCSKALAQECEEEDDDDIYDELDFIGDE